MGMGRAFQYAGAKSVLVSLWSVAEASTTLLVERFFSHLKNGADKVSALRQAREDVIRAGYRHPFFWSPFILIGGGDKPRTEARPATVQRTPERVARAETPRTRDCPAVASRGIISHFVRVKTMGIGGTREGKFTFRNILFASNSATPKKGSLCQLFELGKALSVLTRHRGMRFRIEGHTDARGSDAYNRSLSQRRAGAVARHLIRRHAVPRSNLRGIGVGESRPVASNESDKGRRLNRRVEVVLDE
jgi:outer membrane protein OmpA-like peptidoglycan-associated protein